MIRIAPGVAPQSLLPRLPGQASLLKRAAAVAVLVLLLLPAWTLAGDVTTLSGTTFREVRLVRVEPDGVIWEHANGIVKVDFTDLPKSVQRAYHYDAGKAAAFQAAQIQARQQAASLAQQDQRNLEARRAQQAQRQSAASTVEGGEKLGFVLSYHDRAVEKAEQVLGEQMAARKAAQAKLTEYDGTIWDRRIWAIPCMFLGHSDGHLFDRPDMDSDEYKRSLLSSPENQAYYEGIDRAAAFARGKP